MVIDKIDLLKMLIFNKVNIRHTHKKGQVQGVFSYRSVQWYEITEPSAKLSKYQVTFPIGRFIHCLEYLQWVISIVCLYMLHICSAPHNHIL
jgi:hypothetical protein